MNNGVFSSILCADWGKPVAKRAVYFSDVANRCIRRLTIAGGWSLRSLLSAADRLASNGPILVAVDAPFGVPASYLASVRDLPGWSALDNFVDLLRHVSELPHFFQPTGQAIQWKLDQPFFAVPSGNGSLLAFHNAARAQRAELLRAVDKRTRAKSLFITSGIPGSVGSATVALWRELGPLLEQQRDFRIWPFEGELETLCGSSPITLAETYPRAAYATALRNTNLEVCPPVMLAKTDAEARRSAIAALTKTAWVGAHDVKIEDLDHAQNCEDDFDACITAAALLRCQLESLPLCEGELFCGQIEGGILGTGSIDLSLQEQRWQTIPSKSKRIRIATPGSRPLPGSPAELRAFRKRFLIPIKPGKQNSG